MDERLIGGGQWQRVLERLRQEPHMHTHDLDGLRRFASACFLVLRRLHLGRAWVLRSVR